MSSTSLSHPYRSNHLRAQLTVIGLALSALGSVMLMVESFTLLSFLQRVARGVNVSLADAHLIDQRVQAIAILQLIVYLGTGVLFLRWIYRAYQNHAALNPGRAAYSAGWAVWGFIVPIMNLFRPYQVVRDLWDALPPIDPDNPFESPRLGHGVIISWWLAFITPNLINRALTSARLDDSPAAYTRLVLMTMFSEAILIAAALLAIRIVQTIDLRHEIAARRLIPLTDWPPIPHWSKRLYGWPFSIAIAAAIVIWGGSPPVVPIETAAIPAPASVNTLVPTRPPDPRTPVLWATEAAAKSVTKVPTRIPTKTPVSPVKLNTAAKEALEYYENGAYRFALVEFNKALQFDPDNASYYLYRGRTYQQLDSPEAALQDFDQALTLDPTLAEAYFERGWIYYWDDNYGKARSDFEQALKLDDEYPDAYVGRGFTYYALEDYARALTDLNKAVKLDAAYSEAYYGRGLVYYATSDYLKSVQDFSKTVELDADWPQAYYRRGMAHYAMDNLTAAHADFDRAIELDPDYADPYFDRGVLLYNRGRYRDALADFDRVVEAHPEEGIAYLWRGAIYAKLGDHEQAIADLEQAVKWSTDADMRREAEDMLQELRGEKRPTS